MKRQSRLLAGIVLTGIIALLHAAPPIKGKLEPLQAAPVQAVDYTNMTFTVTRGGTNLTLYITSGSRFFKGGKYATSREITIGETVHGTIKAIENRHEAVRIFIGKKSVP